MEANIRGTSLGGWERKFQEGFLEEVVSQVVRWEWFLSFSGRENSAIEGSEVSGGSISLGMCSLQEERGETLKVLAEMSLYQRCSDSQPLEFPTGLTTAHM